LSRKKSIYVKKSWILSIAGRFETLQRAENGVGQAEVSLSLIIKELIGH
jgi:hypothetical protein